MYGTEDDDGNYSNTDEVIVEDSINDEEVDNMDVNYIEEDGSLSTTFTENDSKSNSDDEHINSNFNRGKSNGCLKTYIFHTDDVYNFSNPTNFTLLPSCEPGINLCGNPSCLEAKVLTNYFGPKGEPSLLDWYFYNKLVEFSEELRLLYEGKHPALLYHVKGINKRYKEEVQKLEIWYQNALENVELEYEQETRMIEEEYEYEKEEIKESMINELEEQKKIIDNERLMMYVNGDFIDPRPMIMRKLRKRPNEVQSLAPERKKRSEVPTPINFMASEKDIENDVRVIQNAIKEQTMKRKIATGGAVSSMPTTRSASAAAAAALSGKSTSNPNKTPGSSKANDSSSTKGTTSKGSGHSSSKTCSHPKGSNNSASTSKSSSTHSHKMSSSSKASHESDHSHSKHRFSAKIDHGKLKYEKKWFLRGQPVYVEGKNLPRYSGIISSIKSGLVWVHREDNSGSRLKVRVSQLIKGKITIKRRAD